MDNYNLTTLCNLEHNPHRFLKQLKSLNTQIENLDKKFTQPLNKFSDEFNTTLTELENKKGRILGWEYQKDPSNRELLELIQIHDKYLKEYHQHINSIITELNKIDQGSLELITILAGLSGMTYKRISDAFAVIEDTEKILDKNSNISSEQGHLIKEVVKLHIERIKEDKERFEKIDNLISQYRNIDNIIVEIKTSERENKENLIELRNKISKLEDNVIIECEKRLENERNILKESFNKKIIYVLFSSVTLSSLISLLVTTILH